MGPSWRTHVLLKVLHDKREHDVDLTLAALKDDGQHEGDAPQGPSAGPEERSSGLGIGVDEQDGRVVVVRVLPNGPADGKLRSGDVVEEVNHQPVVDARDLASKVRAAPADAPVLLRVKRGDQSRYVAVERRDQK